MKSDSPDENNNSSPPPGDDSSSAKLSARELEIVRLVIAGMKNRLIAAHLFISIRTVQNHRFRLCQKLDCHSVVDLMRWAIRNGLL